MPIDDALMGCANAVVYLVKHFGTQSDVERVSELETIIEEASTWDETSNFDSTSSDHDDHDDVECEAER